MSVAKDEPDGPRGHGDNPISSPTGAAPRRHVVLVAALAVASFLVTFEDSAVSVALPVLRSDLGLRLAQLEWTLNAYTLGLVAVLLLAGKLVDRFGARPTLAVGLALFTTASVPAALAQSGGLLIAARAVQGIGAGFIAPASLAMISLAFPTARRGVAVGVVAGVSAIGLGAGPLLGGIVVEYLGWSGLFLVNIPIGIALFVVTAVAKQQPEPSRASARLDLAGAAAAGSALLLSLLAITRGTRDGWGSPQVLALAAAALASSVAFAAIEHRAEDPVAPPALLRSRQLTGAAMVGLLSTAAMFSLFFFISLYLQTVVGYSVVATGATFLPMTAVIAVGSPLAGILGNRLSAAALATTGMALVSVAMLLLARLDDGLGLLGIILGLAVAGLGVALTATPVTTSALSALPPDRQGLAGSLVGTARAIGLAIGVAVMGAILSTGGDTDLAVRLSTGLKLNAALAAVGAIGAALLLRSTEGHFTVLRSTTDTSHTRPRRKPAPTEEG